MYVSGNLENVYLPFELLKVNALSGSGLAKYDGQTWTRYTITNSPIPSDNIRDVAIDNNNKLWIATPQGLTSFDGISWHNYFAGTYINKIAIDHNNNIWISTVYGALLKFDGVGNYVTYSPPTSSYANSFLGMTIDADNNLYIGTDSGMVKIDTANSSFYSIDNSGRPTTSVQPDNYTEQTIQQLEARGHTKIKIKN